MLLRLSSHRQDSFVFSFPSLVLPLPLSPQLIAVDDVLPEDVSRRCHSRQRMEVRLGHPNGKDRILLPEALAGRDRITITTADAPSDEELRHAQHERDEEQPHYGPRILAAVLDQEANGDRRDDEQRKGPQVKRHAGRTEHDTPQSGRKPTDGKGREQRQKEEREDAFADVQERLNKGQVFTTVNADQGEVDGSDGRHGDVAEDDVGSEEAHIAAQHTRDDRRRGGRRRQQTEQGAAGDDPVDGAQQQVEAAAAHQLDEQQPHVLTTQTDVARLDLAEGEEQHGEDQVRRQEGQAADPRIGQRTGQHGDRQHPVFEKLQHPSAPFQSMGMYCTKASMAS